MITISHLSHRYKLPDERWLTVLRDVSLTITEGEYVAIIGPNGSGKTTFARCLNGLIKPSSGRISIDNTDLTNSDALWEIRRRVGMVFQNPDNQIVSATVDREIAFGLENLGLPSQVIQDRVEAALHKFDLYSYRYHAPHRLSGGEKQRLTLASVMSMKPRYLVLDEPTSLLDPRSRQELIALLSEIHSQGKTILHITQFPEEALQAERLILLVEGQIVEDSDPLSIFNQPDALRRWSLEAPVAFQLNEALRESGLSFPIDILLQEKDTPYLLREDSIDTQNTSEENKKSESRLVADKVSHVYDTGLPSERQALRDITLRIDEGECVAIIGSTGSGKTTLTEHFMGLLKPSQGRVCVDGAVLWQTKEKTHATRSKVGLVFQFPELQFFEETVKDEIAFGPRNLGLGDEEIMNRTGQALDLVGLDLQDFGLRSPLTLSSGEQRLVAIASILSMEPEILILDEPTAGLDPQGVQRIFDLIRRLHEDGVTILFISHHIDLIAQVAQRVIVLNEGTIILDGSPQYVFQHHKLLRSIGLDIPRLAKIMRTLRQKNWSVRDDIFTLQEAKEEILAHRPASNF